MASFTIAKIRNSIAIEISGGNGARAGISADWKIWSDRGERAAAGTVIQKNGNGAIAEVCDGEIEMAVGIEITRDDGGRSGAGLQDFIRQGRRVWESAIAFSEQDCDGGISLVDHGEIDVAIAIEIVVPRARRVKCRLFDRAIAA